MLALKPILDVYASLDPKNILKRCDDLKVTAEEDCLSCTLEIMNHPIKLTLNAVSEKKPFDFAAEAALIEPPFDDLISGHALYEESLNCIVGLFEDITAKDDSEDETKARADTRIANFNLRISQSSENLGAYKDQFSEASEKFTKETLISVLTPDEWAIWLHPVLLGKNLSPVLADFLKTKLEMLSGVELEEEGEEVSFEIDSDSGPE